MIKTLDCTIRDGGYLRDWNFSKEEFLRYIDVAQKIGVDFFEIGYRSNASGGRFRRCLKSELSDVIPYLDKINPIVMLNCKEFDENLFSGVQEDFVSSVRVAAHCEEIPKAIQVAEYLLDKGYKVFLHIMNVMEMTNEDYEFLKNWNRKSEIISLYFADSYGSFFVNDIEKFYKNFQKCGYEKISFHAHNNIQMAFANSLKVAEMGGFCIDVTTGGIGRGGGNLPSELLFAYLKKQNLKDVFRIYSEVLSEDELKKIIGGIQNLHPSKIDDFLK